MRKNEVMAALLIPSGNINNWGDDLNKPAIKNDLFKNGIRIDTEIHGQTIYMCDNRNGYGYTEYFAVEKDDNDEDQVVFYSQVKKNQKRNNLFKPKVGRYQSLIWKEISWESGTNFASDFMLDVLLKDSSLCPMVITDMKQTIYGGFMWIRTLSSALNAGYNCYFGLSAPTDAKCIIKINSIFEIRRHYNKDILNENSAYAYRCALITRPSTKIESLLLDPKHTLILTNKEAEELGAYEEPIDLDNLQFDDMLDEYFAVK